MMRRFVSRFIDVPLLSAANFGSAIRSKMSYTDMAGVAFDPLHHRIIVRATIRHFSTIRAECFCMRKNRESALYRVSRLMQAYKIPLHLLRKASTSSHTDGFNL